MISPRKNGMLTQNVSIPSDFIANCRCPLPYLNSWSHADPGAVPPHLLPDFVGPEADLPQSPPEEVPHSGRTAGSGPHCRRSQAPSRWRYTATCQSRSKTRDSRCTGPARRIVQQLAQVQVVVGQILIEVDHRLVARRLNIRTECVGHAAQEVGVRYGLSPGTGVVLPLPVEDHRICNAVGRDLLDHIGGLLPGLLHSNGLGEVVNSHIQAGVRAPCTLLRNWVSPRMFPSVP